MDKLIKLFNKDRLISSIVIYCLIFLISTLWHPFSYVSLAIILALAILLNFSDTLGLLLFSLFFSRDIIFFIGTSAICGVALFVRVIYDIAKKKKQIAKLPLILTAIICVAFSCIFYEANIYSVGQGLLTIVFLCFIYVCFLYRKDINISRCVQSMFFGLVLSLFVSLVASLIPICSVYCFDSFSYSLANVKSIIKFNDGSGNRWSFLTFHVNHMSVFCSFLLAYSIMSLLKLKKIDAKLLIYFGLMCIVSAWAGVMTMSKAFIVILTIVAFYAVVMLIIKFKKKSLYFIVPFLSLCIIALLIFREKFLDISKRFMIYGGETLLSRITTGRSAIWQEFVDFLTQSPAKLLFGAGFFSTDIVEIGPHSIFVYILYHFGIVGIVMLMFLIYAYLKEVGFKLHLSIYSILPIIVMLCLAFQETLVDERFYLLVLSMIIAFDAKQEFISQR